MKQKNGKMKSRLLLLLALLLMVPVGVFAQNITVKGTVKDSQGETVIRATVVEKVILLMVLPPIWMVSLRYLLVRVRNW